MAHEAIIDLTEDNFDTEVKQSKIPVLVDFWAEWCGPCKMISPVLDELAGEIGDSAKITKLNIDDCKNLTVEYGVQTIPALLFFADGELKERSGPMSKQAIADKLKDLAL